LHSCVPTNTSARICITPQRTTHDYRLALTLTLTHPNA
jgi:hypothetical protein